MIDAWNMHGEVMEFLVVDDHALFREGICQALSRIESTVSVHEASTCEQAIECVSSNSDLDLVLLDLHLPDKHGFEALDELTSRYPALPVVILSASNLQVDVKCALAKGAVGYIHKDTTSEIMLNALRVVLAGGIYTPPNMLEHEVLEQHNAPAHDLTARQVQVLVGLKNGQSNKLIAAELELAEATVKMHITAIFKCLGVSNRTQAALEAEKLDLNLLLNPV